VSALLGQQLDGVAPVKPKSFACVPDFQPPEL
jgi:hypothetical protein